MRRVPVNSVVRKSVMFSNVIVDIAFPRRSFVFSQSSCEVSAGLTDVEGVVVGATDLIYCSLSVPRFVSVFDVSQYARTIKLHYYRLPPGSNHLPISIILNITDISIIDQRL